jgi:two-component system cell cycle response regulator
MREKSPETQKLPRSAFPPEALSDPEITLAERDTEKAVSVAAPSIRDRASLTLMSGTDAGRVFPLGPGEAVIGRDLEAQVHIDDTSVSRQHARIVRQGTKFLLEDAGSTNGTFVGGRKIQKVELVSGDRIQIGPTLTLRFSVMDEAEELLQRQLYESSTRDPLTRAFNKKYLLERLVAEVAHARRHKTALAVLLFDIDRFKATNDEHGHLVGDAVLRGLAEQVHPLIRVEDVFARFGGEEFVILIRANGTQDAPRLAERLRSSIESLRVKTLKATVSVSVSVGVASLEELGPEATGRDLLAKADERLYRAKEEGRNLVCAKD